MALCKIIVSEINIFYNGICHRPDYKNENQFPKSSNSEENKRDGSVDDIC